MTPCNTPSKVAGQREGAGRGSRCAGRQAAGLQQRAERLAVCCSFTAVKQWAWWVWPPCRHRFSTAAAAAARCAAGLFGLPADRLLASAPCRRFLCMLTVTLGRVGGSLGRLPTRGACLSSRLRLTHVESQAHAHRSQAGGPGGGQRRCGRGRAALGLAACLLLLLARPWHCVAGWEHSPKDGGIQLSTTHCTAAAAACAAACCLAPAARTPALHRSRPGCLQFETVRAERREAQLQAAAAAAGKAPLSPLFTVRPAPA